MQLAKVQAGPDDGTAVIKGGPKTPCYRMQVLKPAEPNLHCAQYILLPNFIGFGQMSLSIDI